MLALEDLHTLSYAAALIRSADGAVDSIAVTLPALDTTARHGLERACGLAVAESPIEVEIAFGRATTVVRVARPGRL